jgi:NAD(P)H dehydrogenase (quinone)
MSPSSDYHGVNGADHAVILCNPNPQSFNATIARTYCDAVRARHRGCLVRDLYSLGFDPVLRASEQPSSRAFVPSDDVAVELAALKNVDVIVLVYPIWFGTPPAMMKGYVERVMGAGFGHREMREAGKGPAVGGKHLVSITTSGNSIQWLEQQGAWLSLKNVFDAYLANAFSLASTDHLHVANVVEDMNERAACEELFRVTQFADATCARLMSVARQPKQW